jgi:hypothetical protein
MAAGYQYLRALLVALHEVRVLREVSASESSTTRDQVARIQASLQRPAALFEN